MTQQMNAARTFAELEALAATLRGKHLTAALAEAGVPVAANDTVAAKRRHLVNYYGRDLNARAIERMTGAR